MVRSVVVGMLVVPLVLAFALAPVAAHPGRHPLARLQTELGLSEPQVQAIRQLHEGQRDVRRQTHVSLRDARQGLRQLVLTGADESQIQAKTLEVQQLLAQAVQLRVETLRGLSQLLTPEQRERLSQLRPVWH